jgi:hypothetical protein
MNVKELLLAQLNACQENTWFVSLLNSIDGLTENKQIGNQMKQLTLFLKL